MLLGYHEEKFRKDKMKSSLHYVRPDIIFEFYAKDIISIPFVRSGENKQLI
jgi:hypothetical protein